MSIGTRLRGERERLGLGQVALGAMAGVAKNTQLNYERGPRTPDANYLAAVARYGVDVLYVVTGRREAGVGAPAAWSPVNPSTAHVEATEPRGLAYLKDERQTQMGVAPPLSSTGAVRLITTVDGAEREYQVIPRIDDRVCAGLGLQSSDEAANAGPPLQVNRGGFVAFERAFLRSHLGADGSEGEAYMTVNIEGDSMAPTLTNGDFIVIDTAVTRVNVSGVYVLRFEGELTVKRVIRKSDGSLLITSDNAVYAKADEHFSREAAAVLHVIGRMVWPRLR